MGIVTYDEFTSLEQGLAYYPLIKDKQIVVKPKSTNFGLAISIFLGSVGSYINRRAQGIESYEDFFERVFTNSKGSLSVKLADTTQK